MFSWLIDLPIVNKSPIILDNIARNTTSYEDTDDYKVFLKIAENSITLTQTIEYIAAHHSSQVRNALINHPNVSRKALDIILFMQGKPGTPVELLRELAENPRFEVLNKLCIYPDVPSEILDIVGNNLPCKDIYDFGWKVLIYLAYHPNSSDNLLQKIITRLKLFSSSISNGGQFYYSLIDIHRIRFQKIINKLTKQIERRLKGEHLAETDKFYTCWAIAQQQGITIEDNYGWEDLDRPHIIEQIF